MTDKITIKRKSYLQLDYAIRSHLQCTLDLIQCIPSEYDDDWLTISEEIRSFLDVIEMNQQ